MVAAPAAQKSAQRSVHVMLLLSAGLRHEDVGFQTVLYRLNNDLEAAGHVCEFAGKSLADLRNDPVRISRFVARTAADAWVVTGGGMPILSWFADGNVPALAIGGRCMGLPIASTGLALIPAFQTAIRRLLNSVTDALCS